MAARDRDNPPKADPRRGRNPGYAEDQPRDQEEARRPATPSPSGEPDDPQASGGKSPPARR
jgi:hypothetical protein